MDYIDGLRPDSGVQSPYDCPRATARQSSHTYSRRMERPANLSGTRRNQAHAIAHQFGIANQALQQLGREADYATFSGRNITPAQSTQYWTSVKRLRTAMLRSMPRLKRFRTQLSLRGVTVRIPRQSRSPSRAEILKTGSAGRIHRTSSVSRPSRASRDNRHQYKSQNTRPADPSRK